MLFLAIMFNYCYNRVINVLYYNDLFLNLLDKINWLWLVIVIMLEEVRQELR